MQASANNAAASLIREVRRDVSERSRLNWRWRIDRVVEKSDIATKQGDDFAARLYVFFDYPLDRLSLVDRTKLQMGYLLDPEPRAQHQHEDCQVSPFGNDTEERPHFAV